MSNAIPLSGLARRLVKDGILDEENAQNAYQQAAKENTSFVKVVVNNQYAEATDVAQSACDEFGSPYFDFSVFNMDALPRGLVDHKLVRKLHALPLFSRGGKLFIGISDPTNLRAIDDIKFHTGMRVDAVLLDETSLAEGIEQYITSQEEELDTGFDDLEDGLEDIDVESLDEGADLDEDSGASAADETPIVRFVNKILLDAIRQGSSDVHFEPYEKHYRIRYRTDGVLHEASKPPINLANRLAARLKVMSRMDISERRRPQDGRIKMNITKTRSIDFRVNTLPTLWGEKVVLRILDPASAQMGIDALGYEADQKALYLHALSEPQGMILVTGPTGSGKTVSLYTGLNILNTSERNISTAEDPVEINMAGINQVNVNPKVGLDFSSALRSFLRQDPDIIMVGEIRDLETAEIGIKAAQTGHLVLSTLHTNSAAETVTRLLNMGVASFNVATTVSLIIAQRLARRLCSKCAEPADDVPKQVRLDQGFLEEELESMTLMHPNLKGCPSCHLGYKGRVGIYEVVRITPGIARLIMEGANAIDISEQMRKEGFSNLRRSALKKAADGMTSLEEVNRVTKD
ncbi:MAG: type IV-A pilus assembly ATPase PilB [Pseudomonadales bacterium]